MIHKCGSVDAGRFATIGWMDWSDVERITSCRHLRPAGEAGGAWSQGDQVLEGPGVDRARGKGKLVRVDDERLAPIFDKAAELGIPVMFHIADPDAFFLPIDANATSAMRNWQRTLTGAFTALNSPKQNCLISVIA